MIGLFGTIDPPLQNAYFQAGSQGQGLFLFLSNLFMLVGTVAGIYMIVLLITAGYAYLGASGDPKKVELAGSKILQSIIGLVIIAAAFIIAGLVGRFTGINILNPTIYGPSN